MPSDTSDHGPERPEDEATPQAVASPDESDSSGGANEGDGAESNTDRGAPSGAPESEGEEAERAVSSGEDGDGRAEKPGETPTAEAAARPDESDDSPTDEAEARETDVAESEGAEPAEADAVASDRDGAAAISEAEGDEPAEGDGVDVDMDGEGDNESFEVDLDEIEELDEFEEIPVEEAPAEAAAEVAAPKPPPPPRRPPPPPTPPRPPRTPAPPPQQPTEAGPPPVEEPEPAPLETALESPTVLEKWLAEDEERGWERRAEHLTRDLESASDKAQIAVLAYELGELYSRRLADEARAVKAYGRALQSDPSFRANLWAIRRVFYRRGLWPNLLKLIDAELRFARDDDERADLHLEKGNLLEDQLERPVEANDAYAKAVALNPASCAALLSLERVATQDGDEESLARLWRLLAEASSSPGRRLAYYLDLIRLRTADASDRDALTEAMELLAAARELGPEAGGAEALAREHERLAELSGSPAELLEALETRVANLLAQFGPAGPEPAEGKPREQGAELDRATSLKLQIVALRRRQSRVALEQLQDGERAWSYLEQALALVGGEPLILADLADLAEQQGKFDELAELCQGWESLEGDPARSLSLSLRRADALFRGGQREEANKLLDSLIAGAPGYLPITALRERAALAEGDWSVLAKTYRDCAEAAQLGSAFGPGASREPDPTTAARYYVAAGDVSAFQSGATTEAAEDYQRALETVPGFAPAVEALTALYESSGKLEEATQLLELHSEAGDAEQRTATFERLVRLYEQLDRPAEVLEVLRRLLALAPDSVNLRWRIEETLAKLGRASDRVDVLLELAEKVSDPPQRAAIYLDAARVCDSDLSAPERAAELYRKVLEIWPNDRYSRSALVAMLRRSQRWEELVAERRAEAAQLDDGPALARALREAASVLRDKLDRPADAAEVYRELVDRMPGDGHALRGLADALARTGNDEALVEVLAVEAEAHNEPGARAGALLKLGAAYERLNRDEDALEAYRRAAEAAPESANGVVAMAEVASRSRDASTRVEALGLLADQRLDDTIRSEILEEVGWLWAMVLEDYEKAAEAFAAAAEADPQRRGPILGIALVQTKREAVAEAGDALAELATRMHGAYAASSMLLRAGAIAEVAGDSEVAHARVAQAAATAPDDSGTLVVAAEYLPAAAADGVSAEGAAEQLLQRASILGMRAALASDTTSRDDWELDRAELLEGAGRLRDAADLLAAILARRPDDVRALQILRRVCRRGGDMAGLARASMALGLIIGDPDGKVELLREAAAIFDTELQDMQQAVRVYRRILTEEPGAPEYERLRQIYGEHEDVGGLIGLLGDRLNWLSVVGAEDAERARKSARDSVPLLLERSRLREKLGDLRGASRDLSALLDIDDMHPDALAAQARVVLRAGDAAAAAELYQRYLEVELDPEKRAPAELALSQILADDMQDLTGAIEQLEHVLEQTKDDLEVRERLVDLLVKAADWERAVYEIREVERLRSSPVERARDELRVAAVFRDRLDEKDKARTALENARRLDPLNLDSVRELAALAEGDKGRKARRKVLESAISDVRAVTLEEPSRAGLYERLAVLAQWNKDEDVRYFALGALESVGSLSKEQDELLKKRRRKLEEQDLIPDKAISGEDWLARVAHPHAAGLAAELWETLAEAAAKAIGLDAAQLGFARNHKVSGRGLEKSFPAVAKLVRCFGLSNYELYVSDTKSGYARVVSTPKPVLYLSADVARPKTANARFTLARAVAQARDRTGTLAELRAEELELLFAAAAQVAGVSPPPSALFELTENDPDGVAERAKELQKQLGRRDKKNLALVSSRFSELGSPRDWRRAALSTSWRAGMLVAGDVYAALDILDVGRGGRSIHDDKAALELLAWTVGEDHMALREQLGISSGA